MQITNLQDLFKHELQDLYSAENQIIKALPKMLATANHDKLKKAFQKHLDATKDQRKRLEDIASHYNFDYDHHTCKGIQGIISEAEEFMNSHSEAEPDVIDAALITLAQRVEHYEIAGYGAATQYADLLKKEFAKDKLGTTLDEEKHADEKLTAIAKGGLFSTGINEQALH